MYLDLKNKLVHLSRKDCAATGLATSKRLVPLSSKSIELLNNYPKTTNTVIDLSIGAARHGFNRARTIACLPNLRFHDLRHIAISSMWAEGMNALEVSAASGHKDLRMLMRYSHYPLGHGGNHVLALYVIRLLKFVSNPHRQIQNNQDNKRLTQSKIKSVPGTK